MLAELEGTVTALRTELEAAAAGDEESLAAAAALLVADVDAVTEVPTGDGGSTSDADATPPEVDPDGPAPVLPGPLVSREESIQYGDVLTRTLAAARSAGSAGETGPPVPRRTRSPATSGPGSGQLTTSSTRSPAPGPPATSRPPRRPCSNCRARHPARWRGSCTA